MESDVIQERLLAALVGRYVVEELLDVGGTALVFRARDAKHGRTVAIKVLRPELAVTVGAQRFLQEIRIAANLSHPNILPLHDSGEADGLLFYVMPFVEGESLREYLADKGSLAPPQALRITQEVARGLAHAHASGIVHRDVKPENILMSGGVAVVADFGIAKAMEAAGADLTQTGSAPSTPRYASPEQLWGEGEIDHASDQYSLACVVFEMLAGKAPFEGSLAAIATKKVAEEPPSLSQFRPDLPKEISLVLARALSRQRAQRFEGVAAFLQALEGAMGGVAGPPRSERRSWRALGAGGLAVALVLAGLYARFGGSGVPHTDLPETPVLAVLPFEHVGVPETSYLTDGMTDEVATRIGKIPDLSVVSLASSRLFDAKVEPLDRIGRELAATHILMGSIRIDGSGGEGRIRFTPRLVRVSDTRELWSRTLDADLLPGQIFDVQASVAEEVARALDVVFSPGLLADFKRPTESLEAYGYYLRASPLGAQFLVEQDTRSSIEMYERAVAVDPDFARAYAGLGKAQSLYYYFFDRSPQRYEAASYAVARAVELAPDDPDTRVAQGYLAYWGQSDYAAAIEAFMAAGAADASDSELLWVLASVQRRQGRYEEALRTFRRGARLDPRSALNTFEAGGTLVMQRRFEEAIPLARRVRALSPTWLPGALAEAVALVYQARTDEATAYLDALVATDEDRRNFLPLLVEEVIYRPFWEGALSEGFQEALERATSGDFSDPSAYHLARMERARRLGDHAALRAFADSAARVLRGRVDARPDDAWARIDLAGALIQAARPTEAATALEGLDARTLVARDAFRGPFWAVELVRAQARSGDTDSALENLEYLQTVPVPVTGPLLRNDPALASLWGIPRFEAIADGFSRPLG